MRCFSNSDLVKFEETLGNVETIALEAVISVREIGPPVLLRAVCLVLAIGRGLIIMLFLFFNGLAISDYAIMLDCNIVGYYL
jgi:hypothetical protein